MKWKLLESLEGRDDSRKFVDFTVVVGSFPWRFIDCRVEKEGKLERSIRSSDILAGEISTFLSISDSIIIRFDLVYVGLRLTLTLTVYRIPCNELYIFQCANILPSLFFKANNHSIFLLFPFEIAKTLIFKESFSSRGRGTVSKINPTILKDLLLSILK